MAPTVGGDPRRAVPYVGIADKKNSAGMARAELAARQHGVISRNQLRKLGFADTAIAEEIAAARLHPVFHGVFALGHPGIGAHGRMLAAVLACGESAVVSHRSAAGLLGLRDKAPVLIDVIAPKQFGRKIDGVRRHHVRPPGRDETVARFGIPCTSTARTLVDLAGVLGPHSLRGAVERAAVLEELDLAAIRSALTPRRRGAPMLRRILEPWRALDGQQGEPRRRRLRSELEARMLALIGRAGLPVPLCNHRIRANGRRLEVDFLWREEMLVVETDGRLFHRSETAFERDRRRDRDLALAGYRVMRITWAQVEDEPDAVIGAIRGLLVR